jgi:hypothetical protein
VVLTAWQDRPNSLESGGEGPRRFVPMAAGATHILWPERDGLRLLGRDEVEITAEATQDGGHFGTVRRLAPGTALPGRATSPGRWTAPRWPRRRSCSAGWRQPSP